MYGVATECTLSQAWFNFKAGFVKVLGVLGWWGLRVQLPGVFKV